MDTNSIIEASKRVFANLGTGHSESTYHKALSQELNAIGIHHCCERNLTITYEDSRGNVTHLNTERIDVFVFGDPNPMVLELKAIPGELGNKEIAQITKYAVQLRKENIIIKNSLIINFPQANTKGIPNAITYINYEHK
tara:strand:- start:95 stop:511 length:417 start_codon:yes stop_codon:yes gene_type:complete